MPSKTSHTSNQTIQLFSCSKGHPLTEFRHQIQLAIMLPLHLITSPVQFQPLSHELSVHIILFQALLTLFSKFFSVFLHSTSLLSVFLLYLDFDEYYHLFNLYFQINLLCSQGHSFHHVTKLTRLSLSQAGFSEPFAPSRNC